MVSWQSHAVCSCSYLVSSLLHLSDDYPSIYRCHSVYEREMQALLKQRQEIELQFPTLCLPDPDPSGLNNCVRQV